MKIFIDTANIEEVKAAYDLGVIAGVTTNPSLAAKEGRAFEDVLHDILGIVDGPVSAQVTDTEAKGMIAQGEDFAALSDKVTVKVPMGLEGLKAVAHFAKRGIKTNVTLIFTINQALMASRAGATFVSPFINRLENVNHDGLQLIEGIADLFTTHAIPTEIIAASIRTPYHVTKAAQAGAHIGTMPYDVIRQLVQHPLTDQGVKKFLDDWSKYQAAVLA
ncbi:fructose-6-phosphate aldolase [Tumebacillus algifaecis]|uniref:Fructose-6-phosphate aldolase n=1 Tax=Tumebacillus algifaecis TaxID=1214604 RepID=A0A223CWZ4_9BACL|nr:fructose-6-phosphate aldolase [Tumebacillus algifaecis]ASS73663.1 fructose-6-phosphate aldolase [Tumebacillus algifaecis]